MVCDTIPLSDEIKALPNVRTLTLSGMLAEAIRRISNEESIPHMFCPFAPSSTPAGKRNTRRHALFVT
ncbi:ribose-phosphate pyrophosphokinase [Enterobacter cloacae]|nr:ribose-phosphate pyrophosphokinase [Enterobacter cloacae]